MEGLFVLVAVLTLAVPVTVVILVIAVLGLRGRVSRLEGDLRRLAEDRLVAAAQVRPAMAVDAAPVAPPPVEPAADASPVAPDLPSPWQAAAVAAAAEGQTAVPEGAGAPADPPRAADGPVVMTGARVSALGDWLRDNWVYAVSALSLAFAGVFFVQYGVEKGLLPPPVRVMMAILFGLALVAAGEVIRRRSGDGPRVSTAYLPSTFSGAGLVSMFAGILAARQLYGLIGPEAAFAGLVAVAVLGVVLGWFYGPFLAAVGLIGAGAAPFVVGGQAEAASGLYAYFALVAAAGLAVDAVRRWAWVSVLALAVGYGGAWMVLEGTGAGTGWYFLTLTGLALLAVLVPCLRLQPDHDGPMVTEAVLARGAGGWPIFPTRLAGGALALSVLGLTGLWGQTAAESTLAFLGLALLALTLIWWSAGARALSDLALLPALGFVVRVAGEGAGYGPMASDYAAGEIGLRAAETAPPMTAAMLLGMALAVTLLAAWRSRGPDYRPHWAAVAALVAPLTAVALELFWQPARVLGTGPWAFHILALAGVMTGLAVRFARADGEDRRRAAYATLSTLSLIALALFLILTKGALTLALAALVVVAAALDRRFRLPEMGLFIQAAIAGLSWRLVVDPGLFWAIDRAALWEVFAAYGGAAVAMAGGIYLLTGLDRRGARVVMESAGAGFAALFVNVLITRWLTAGQSDSWLAAHWALTLNALPWAILMLTQLYRLQLGGALRWLRWAIAAGAGLLAVLGIGAAVLPANPLFGEIGGAAGLVQGPPVLDSLFVAYAVPALLFLLAVTRLAHVNRWIRWALTAAGAGLGALYAGLEIRRLWRGDDLSVAGVTQPELYSYTLAMMAVGAALLYQAIARGAPGLRRAAMAVIALTVAKVFLVDAAGLTGLVRVFSFLALGLSLAALAWLNRWAAGRQG